MFSVVVVTRDVVGERMAGPGIRAWHLAEELRKHFPTTLIAKGSPSDGLREASVIIGQPARGLRRRRRGQRIVFDLFDPVLLELREMYGTNPNARQRVHVLAEWWRLRRALTTGDLFLCATPQQRELYPAVAERIVEVPFGAEQNAPHAAVRDNVIVWGGGLWPWLDPETATAAVAKVNAEGVSAVLLFLGRNRPGGAVISDWVPYAERLDPIAKCKVAIMLHHDTPEARYSIRTRFFDALAASVPVVATAGGFVADLVEKETLGIVVPPGDVDAVAAAIRTLITDDAFHARCVSNLERVRPRFSWDIVTRPLVEVLERWKRSI